MKIVTYTAITADKCPPRTDIPVHSDYNLFKDPRRNAKIYKCLPHLYYPDADWTIWVDGNVKLNVQPETLVKMTGDKLCGVFPHWERDCIYDEASICKRFKLDDPQTIDKQMAYYRRRAYPSHAGLGMCFLIVRRNDYYSPILNARWWAEICRGSVRDQLSFPYIWRGEVQYFPPVSGNDNDYFTRSV